MKHSQLKKIDTQGNDCVTFYVLLHKKDEIPSRI